MKKILLIALFCYTEKVFPQHFNSGKFDAYEYGKELVATNLSLVADKNLCELGEMINVHIRITVVPGEAAPEVFNYDFRDPADAPWKIGDFKIISGGAIVVMNDGNTAQIKMPLKMPADKAVVVQVSLIPVSKQFQQVQLFTTIYLEDHPNVFYFHCPPFGIEHEKYVIEQNNGMESGIDKIQKNAASKNKPQTKAVQTKLAQKMVVAEMMSSGYDLGVLTSNARAMYVKEQNITTITLTGDKVEMVNGKLSSAKRSFMINISFPGSATGSYTIKSTPEITAAIVFPLMGKTCSCQDDPAEKQRREEAGEKGPTCFGGTITIYKYDKKNKIIEGSIAANLEGADNANIIYGNLYGKFSVKLAN